MGCYTKRISGKSSQESKLDVYYSKDAKKYRLFISITQKKDVTHK